MPAPATSSRHLYTGHRQGNKQVAPWLTARRQGRAFIPDVPKTSGFDATVILSMRQQWFTHVRLLVAYLTR